MGWDGVVRACVQLYLPTFFLVLFWFWFCSELVVGLREVGGGEGTDGSMDQWMGGWMDGRIERRLVEDEQGEWDGLG